MRSCLKGIDDSRCDCREIEGAICALASETPFGNNPCPIQRASSRSNATTGLALITGKQRQWPRSLGLENRQD
jgi:hypothetical protein